MNLSVNLLFPDPSAPVIIIISDFFLDASKALFISEDLSGIDVICETAIPMEFKDFDKKVYFKVNKYSSISTSLSFPKKI